MPAVYQLIIHIYIHTPIATPMGAILGSLCGPKTLQIKSKAQLLTLIYGNFARKNGSPGGRISGSEKSS